MARFLVFMVCLYLFIIGIAYAGNILVGVPQIIGLALSVCLLLVGWRLAGARKRRDASP